MSKKGLILTISAPSGTGKDSICSALMGMDNNISFFATATTRDKRAGEVDTVDYYFLTEEKFKDGIEEDRFLEWVEYNGNYYGTLRNVIEGKLNQGLDITSDLTWDGVNTLSMEWPEQTVKFLFMPPSPEELEKRLKMRRQQSQESAEGLMERIRKGVEDATHWQDEDYQFTSPDLIGSDATDYDYIIVNENLDDTVKQVHGIIKQERAKRDN